MYSHLSVYKVPKLITERQLIKLILHPQEELIAQLGETLESNLFISLWPELSAGVSDNWTVPGEFTVQR